MNIYYVYAYIRKKDNTPYYIGKGKDNRAFAKHPGISVPKDRTKIIFLEKRLSEVGALAIERRMINWYGRKDLGTGILLNRTNGGEGGKGGSKKGRNLSENTRKKLSDAGKKRTQTEETKLKIAKAHFGKSRPPFSKEWRENLSKNHKGKTGRKLTDEQKQHLSNINSRPVYCLTNNTWYSSRRDACAALNLKISNVGHCLAGYQKSTGGFKFSYYS